MQNINNSKSTRVFSGWQEVKTYMHKMSLLWCPRIVFSFMNLQEFLDLGGKEENVSVLYKIGVSLVLAEFQLIVLRRHAK